MFPKIFVFIYCLYFDDLGVCVLECGKKSMF